jgi:PAS domain S-box-containing protein
MISATQSDVVLPGCSRAAMESEHLLAAIVESSDDAIVSKDLSGVVTSWNKSAERIFGYTPQEIVGKPITVIIPPELHDQEPHILAKIQAGERIEHFQTVRVHRDGHLIDVSLTVSPVRDSRGVVIGAAKIARDVTDQKKLEAAFHTSERLASVGRLAATIAHEINNPLEAVTNYIFLANAQPDLPEKARRYLAQADRELGRVTHIAQQTLGFYRDNSQPGLLAVAEVVDDVLAVYERKMAFKSLKVETQVESGLVLVSSEGVLKQVLSNLIANAIDACGDGGKVVLRAHTSRHFRDGRPGIRIIVADNGTGIAPKDQPRVFAPFFTTKKDVGTGLGLWVSKELLEKRGGRLWFRSRQGPPSGTVMNIYVPLEGADVAEPAA